MVPQETEKCHSPVPARGLFLRLPPPHATADRTVYLEATRQGQEEIEEESQEKTAATDGKEASRYSPEPRAYLTPAFISQRRVVR